MPVNKKVRIITTANDVIHAWGMPAFGVKQDAIPGFVRDTWFKREDRRLLRPVLRAVRQGTRVHADPRESPVGRANTPQWVDGEKKKMAAKQDDPNKVWTLDDINKRGEKVYAANCAACHQANGKGAGPIRRWTVRRSCWTPTRASKSRSC